MNEDEVILLQIRVSEEDVEKKVGAAREQIVRLRKEQAELDKELKKGAITDQEYANSQKAIATHLEKANKVIEEGEQTLTDYAKMQQAAAQSLGQMQKSLSILTPAQKAHAQSTKDVQERIKELNTELKAEEALIKATATSMDKLDDVIAELDETYRGLNQSQRENPEVGGRVLAMQNRLIAQQEKNQRVIDNSRKTLKDYIRDVDVLGINVGATVDSFKNGAQGVELFTKGMSGARIAAIALVAVPIVALLAGLYVVLTRSQKGMDALARFTSGLSAVFSAFSNKIIAVTDAFSNSKDKLGDLARFVEQNLINRFKALGIILDGLLNGDWTKATNGAAQFATGVAGVATAFGKAYNAGSDLAKLNQEIAEGEIKLNTERARGEKFIERQKQIAEDTTKSTEARSKAARAAFAESQKIQAAEEALQKKRVAAAQAEAKIGQGTREQRLKISEEQAKLDELSKNRIGERTELQNQLNSIEAEGAAKALENAKKLAAERLAFAETALIQAKKNGEETVEIEAEVLKRNLEFIQARADAEKVAVEKGRGADAQRKLIQAKADQEKLEAAKQTALKISEIVYNAQIRDIESAQALTMQGTKDELKLRIEALQAARNKEQQAAIASIKDAEQLGKENERIVLTYARRIEDAKIEFAKQEANREAEFASLRLQTELDLFGESFGNQEKIAQQRIELEEKTQIKLLNIDKEYGRITKDQYEVRLNAIQARTLASQRELAKQRLEAEARAAQDVAAGNLANTKAGTAAEHKAILDGIEADRKAALAAAGENAAAKYRANAEANRRIRDENERFGKEQIQSVLNVANQTVAIISTIGDAQAQRAYDELDKQQQAAVRSAGTNADLREKIEANYAKKKEKIDREEAERKKKIASIQAVINTAVAVTSAAPNPILMALAALTGIAQLAVIKSQKFAVGGVVDGPSHAQGGVKYRVGNRTVELEGGEAVINKRSTAKYYQQLSQMNADNGWGRTFPGLSGPKLIPNYNPQVVRGVGSSSLFAYGGINTAPVQAGQLIDPAKLAGMIETGITTALATQKPPVLVVSDLHTVEADLSRINRRTSVKIGK